MNNKSSFELMERNGRVFPIVLRKKGKQKIEECPYCGEQHIHGTAGGHRISHCSSGKAQDIIINDVEIPAENGYFIKNI